MKAERRMKQVETGTVYYTRRGEFFPRADARREREVALVKDGGE